MQAELDAMLRITDPTPAVTTALCDRATFLNPERRSWNASGAGRTGSPGT